MMKTKTVKVSSLKCHPDNPNQHPQEQINELSDSLDQFDQVKNIVVWKGFIIAGNGLYLAAKKKKLKTIEVKDVSGWPEDKAIKFMIADNRLAEMGIIDDDILSGLMKDIDEPLDIPGIDEAFLDGLNVSPENIDQSDNSDNDNIVIRLEIISKTWAENSEDILGNIKEMTGKYKGVTSQVKE